MIIPNYRWDHDVTIYDIADVHRGNEAFDASLLEKVVDRVASDKDAFWVSTGDLMECALKDSKSDVYTAMSAEQEYDAIIKELRPIGNKCLGLVESNHHGRFKRATGMSLDKRIMEGLEVGERFLGAMGIIKVTCGRTSYFIAMHHGTGGGHFRGGKVTSLNRFQSIMGGADIYLEGHTHSYDHHIDLCQYIDKKRGLWGAYEAHFVCTGHFIKWDQSYALNLKLKSMPMGVAAIRLKACDAGQFQNKKITVDLFN